MEILRYKTVSSTNTLAHEYAKKHGVDAPTVFVAEGQTAGRGRRGRSFESADGVGLYISFLFKPDEKTATPADITIRAAVAVVRALKLSFGIDADIKWVNDIFYGGKKLGGILAEGDVSEDGSLSFAVLGIGVNLLKRNFSDEVSRIATTVEDIIGSPPDKARFEEALISEFFGILSEDSVISEYKKSQIALGKTVEVRKISGESFFARAVDITDGGELVVLREDGTSEALFSAEISIRI